MLIICLNHSCILATDGFPSSRNHIFKAESKRRERFSSVSFFSANYLLNRTPLKFLSYLGQNWATWLCLSSRETRRMRIFWELTRGGKMGMKCGRWTNGICNSSTSGCPTSILLLHGRSSPLQQAKLPQRFIHLLHMALFLQYLGNMHYSLIC